jgi:hypothetical protein
MKWTMNRIALLSIVLLAIVLSCSTAFAQNKTVKASLDIQMYDVIYITDFVDIKSQQLNPNISGVSLSMSTDSVYKKLWVCVYVELHIQLRGETDQELMHAYTNNFDMLLYPVLAANNFAKGGNSNVYIRDGMNSYWENTALRKRLEDMVTKNPTAPPGKYTVMMKVYPATSENPKDKTLPTGDAIGGDVKTITVQFSTTDEAFVEINDPKSGSFFNNLAPTFSWTSGTPVRVSVYEALPSHRSPQDALTGGNPSLVRQNFDATGHPADFSGNSLTYPGNAERQLEQNKAYVLLVEGLVTTNRGDVMRSSRPVVFRITDDNIGQMLDNFLNTFSGSASATYSTLRADPSNWVAWSPYGSITLDGSTLTQTDLQTLINDLASRPDLKIQLGVENQ